MYLAPMASTLTSFSAKVHVPRLLDCVSSLQSEYLVSIAWMYEPDHHCVIGVITCSIRVGLAGLGRV